LGRCDSPPKITMTARPPARKIRGTIRPNDGQRTPSCVHGLNMRLFRCAMSSTAGLFA
jgi:hypothetical protein